VEQKRSTFQINLASRELESKKARHDQNGWVAGLNWRTGVNLQDA
jgi:hypothetical protein